MLEGQEARVWDQEHWQTPGVVSVQIKKNGEYSVCIRSYSGDWKEPSAPPILFILFYLRLPHWANSTSLVCQWHDFIHEATWEAKPETGNMQGWLVNWWGICDAEGQRPNSPSAKNTLAPCWGCESKWKFMYLTCGWHPHGRLATANCLQRILGLPLRAPTRGPTGQTPRLEGFPSVFENQVLRTDCIPGPVPSQKPHGPLPTSVDGWWKGCHVTETWKQCLNLPWKRSGEVYQKRDYLSSIG